MVRATWHRTGKCNIGVVLRTTAGNAAPRGLAGVSGDVQVAHIVTTTAGRVPEPRVCSGATFESKLAAAQRAEEWAVAALWRDIHPRLLRYFRASLGEGAADDLASDVWLEAAHGLGRFTGDEQALRRWVFTIARRRVIDTTRKQQRRRTHVLDPVILAALPVAGDDEADRRRALDVALAHIAALPADQAQVILLRVLAGLSVGDTAKVLRKRAGTVRVLQHRALGKLAAQERTAYL